MVYVSSSKFYILKDRNDALHEICTYLTPLTWKTYKTYKRYELKNERYFSIHIFYTLLHVSKNFEFWNPVRRNSWIKVLCFLWKSYQFRIDFQQEIFTPLKLKTNHNDISAVNVM